MQTRMAQKAIELELMSRLQDERRKWFEDEVVFSASAEGMHLLGNIFEDKIMEGVVSALFDVKEFTKAIYDLQVIVAELRDEIKGMQQQIPTYSVTTNDQVIIREETKPVEIKNKIGEEQEDNLARRERSHFMWVNVPTYPSGSVKWVKQRGVRDLLYERAVAIQVVHELERYNNVDVTKASNVPQALYVELKKRAKGIRWREIVEQARKLG